MDKPFRWTPASALKFAKKFKNRQALRDANAGCMTYIGLKGLTEKAFAHMEEVIIQSEKNELNDFLVEFSAMLQKKKITFNFHKEYKPVVGERYRVDLLIEFPSLNKKIAIEYKSDRSYWNKEKIKKQTDFYQSHLCKIGVEKTYLVSTKGKYGISKDEFFNEFFKGLENE
jgi:hypothetical protein